MIHNVFAFLIFLLAFFILALTRKRDICYEENTQTRASWGSKGRLYAIAGNHTQVSGTLAGFSVTVIVLLAGLGQPKGKDTLEPYLFLNQSTIGLFMIAFFGYVATGILFSMVSERKKAHAHFLFSVASILYFFSVALSFTALFPLAQLIRHNSLQIMILIILIGTIAGGCFAIAIPMHDLLLVKRPTLARRLFLSISLGTIAAILTLLLVDRGGGASFVSYFMLPACSILVSLLFGIPASTFFKEKYLLPRKKSECPQAEFRLWFAYLTLLAASTVIFFITYLAVVVVYFLRITEKG